MDDEMARSNIGFVWLLCSGAFGYFKPEKGGTGTGAADQTVGVYAL